MRSCGDSWKRNLSQGLEDWQEQKRMRLEQITNYASSHCLHMSQSMLDVMTLGMINKMNYATNQTHGLVDMTSVTILS